MDGALCHKEEEADGSACTRTAHSHVDNCPVPRRNIWWYPREDAVAPAAGGAESGSTRLEGSYREQRGEGRALWKWLLLLLGGQEGAEAIFWRGEVS